jgi:hypothetical protein
MFLVFALLWRRADPAPRRSGRIVAWGLALAVFTELGQALPFIDRDADVFDALADAVGVVSGLGLFSALASGKAFFDPFFGRRLTDTDDRPSMNTSPD